MVTGLTPGANYQFKYRAKNIFGWGPFSATTTVQAAAKPGKTGVPVTSQNAAGDVVITWDAPDDNGDGIDYYTISIKD